MELNEKELGIINRAFEKMPFPDDQLAIDLLREKLKAKVDSLFDYNGESADNMRLDLEAKEYADKVPSEPEFFDKDGNPMQSASRESVREVWKVCSALEKYRKDFFKASDVAPTNDEIRATLSDFRLAWQYLSPENKKKMEALAAIIGYNLPENISTRIVQYRRKNYDDLQNMAKTLKKDKNNQILKNALTEKSRRYLEGFFRDVPQITNPKDVVELGEMALKVNSFIPTTPYGAQYKKTILYREKNAEILSWIQKGYLALGDEPNARSTGTKIVTERTRAAHIRDYTGEQERRHFEQSPESYNFR